MKDSVSLIGQMAQSVVIGLLCSDWSDGPVYSALIVQMAQSVVIGRPLAACVKIVNTISISEFPLFLSP